MSADPYANADDEVAEIERKIHDPRVEGTPRIVRGPETRRAGAGFRPVEGTTRAGAPFTALPYDPRDPNSVGAQTTRLQYDPHRVSGSTGIEEIPDWVLENRVAYDGTSLEWFPAYLQAKATQGKRVPNWAFGFFQRKGRPDLAQWAANVNAALQRQGA